MPPTFRIEPRIIDNKPITEITNAGFSAILRMMFRTNSRNADVLSDIFLH
jgi:hypothetical protein